MALGGSQGQAIVLDNPRDPLAVYQAGQNNQAMRAYRQQQLAANQRKQQSSEIKDLLSYKYDKPEDYFKEAADQRITQANNDVYKILQDNPNADPLDLQRQIRQTQGGHQAALSRWSDTASLIKDKQASLKSMKNVDMPAAQQILNQTIYKKSPDDIDTDFLQNIEQVPAIYDLNGLVADSVEDVKNQYRNTSPGQLQSSPLGMFMEVTEDKMRFKDLDKTMDYILRGNDTTQPGLNQKINGGVISDRIRYNIAQEQIQQAGGDPNDVNQVMPQFKKIQYDNQYAPQVREKLRGILGELNQEDRDVKIQKMGQFKQPSAKEQENTRSRSARELDLDALVVPFGKNGELSQATPRAQEALAKVRGGDFAGGKIIDAKFERGGYTISPEWMAKLAPVINTPEGYNVLKEAVKHLVPVKDNEDKALFTVKTGTMFGEPSTEVNLPMSLKSKNAKVILNALMNQNPGNRKVYYEDLYQQQAAPQYLDDDDEEGLDLDE